MHLAHIHSLGQDSYGCARLAHHSTFSKALAQELWTCITSSTVMLVPQLLKSLTYLGWTLEAVLNHPVANNPRNRQVAELWCGVGSICRAGADEGYVTIGYDKARISGVTDTAGSRCEDITKPSGFFNAILVVLSLVSGGLLWQGTDCSSMGWMNRNNTGRSESNPHGNLNYPPVQIGNAQATAAAFLYALACLRSVHCITENPCNSYLWKLDPWKLVDSVFPLTFAYACRCAFDTAPYGERILKRYKLAGGPWVTALRRNCRCPGRLHRKTTFRCWKGGRLKITGNMHTLKKSGVYPRALGKWVIKKWVQMSKKQASPKVSISRQSFGQQKARKGKQPEVLIQQPELQLNQPQLNQPQLKQMQQGRTIELSWKTPQL